MAELGNAVKDLLTKLLENIPKEQVADKIKGFLTDTLKMEIGDIESFKATINNLLEGDSETAMDNIANYVTGLINASTTSANRGPSYQSSRIYYKGKDHKDIYYQGNWHLALYLLKDSWHCDGYEWMKLHDPEFLDTYDIWMQSYPDLVDHSHEHLMRCEWTGEEKFYRYDLSNDATRDNLIGDILNMDLCRSNSFSKVSFLHNEGYYGNVGFQLTQNERGYYRGYTPFDNSNNTYENIDSPLGKKDMYACVYSDNNQDIWVPEVTDPYELQIFSSMYGAKPSYKSIVEITQQGATGVGDILTMPICQNVGYSIFTSPAGIFSTNGTIVKALYVGHCDDYDTTNYPDRRGLVPRELSLPGSLSLANRINEIEEKYKPDGVLSNYMPFTSAFYPANVEYGNDAREELCMEITSSCTGTTFNRDRTRVDIDWQYGMFQHNGCGYVHGNIHYGYRMHFQTEELAREEYNRIVEATKNMWINIARYVHDTWVTVIINVPVFFKYGEDGITDVWDYISELSHLGLLEVKTTPQYILAKSSSDIFVLSKHNMLYCFYSPWIDYGGEDAPDYWKQYLKTYALKVPFDSDTMSIDDYYSYGTEINFRALDDTGKPISMIFNGLLPKPYPRGAPDTEHGILSIDWESDDISIRFSDLYPLKSCNLVAAYNGSDPRYKYYIFNKSDSAYFSVRSYNDSYTEHPLCLNAPVIRLDSPSAFASGVVWKGSNTTHVKDESEGGTVNE